MSQRFQRFSCQPGFQHQFLSPNWWLLTRKTGSSTKTDWSHQGWHRERLTFHARQCTEFLLVVESWQSSISWVLGWLVTHLTALQWLVLVLLETWCWLVMPSSDHLLEASGSASTTLPSPTSSKLLTPPSTSPSATPQSDAAKEDWTAGLHFNFVLFGPESQSAEVQIGVWRRLLRLGCPFRWRY